MSEYVINNGELYHHGVKGMKWGVRKARDISVKILERKRKRNKSEHIRNEIKIRTDRSKSIGDIRNELKANKRQYKANDAKTAFKIATQKAKLDPNYKNSDEYKTARAEYGKQQALQAIRDLSKPVYTTSTRKDF